MPPRVILSGGRSPKSNPAGVCEAQDLRGGWIKLSEIPTLRVALRVRLTAFAQDDTDGVRSTVEGGVFAH